MKKNLESQDRVLKDQRKRRSTSPAETNTLAKTKEETDGPVPLSRFFGNPKSWTNMQKKTTARVIEYLPQSKYSN